MIIARQSTARTVTIGPILDADGAAVTDGVVGDLKLSKNGGAPAALNASATLTHRHTGFYSLALTASDLDTVGTAEVTIDDTANACPMKEISVIEEAIYDALFAASANAWTGAAGSSIVAANVTQFGGSNGTFASGRPEVNTSHVAGTSQTAGDLAALINTVDGIVDAILLDTAEIGVAGAGLTEAGGTGDHLTALASQTSVNTIDDLLDTEIAALTTELAKVPKSDGTASWNATALAAIQSECNDALVAYDPPTNAEMEARTLAAGSYSTVTTAQVNAEVLDVLNVDTLIDGKTIVAALKIIGAMAGGEVSGAGSGTEVFVGLDGSTTRATVTVDNDGNRTSVVYA